MLRPPSWSWIPCLLLASCSKTPPGFVFYSGPKPQFEWLGPMDGRGGSTPSATVDDADGDGTPDVLLRASWREDGGDLAVLADLYSGRTGQLLHRFIAPCVIGKTACSATFVGDIDGDGNSDLAFGSTSPLAEGRWPCVVSIYSGYSGAWLGEIHPQVEGEHFGSLVAAAGDVDLDGSADLAVVARDITSGVAPGLSHIELRSGRTGIQLARIYSTDEPTSEIVTLHPVGDVNGDGQVELFVRTKRKDRTDQLNVVSCGSPGLLWSVHGDGSERVWLYPPARIADQDGDQIKDMVIPLKEGARVVSTRTGAHLSNLSVPKDLLVIGPIGDWDRDGTEDLLVRSDEGRSVGWDNNIYSSFQVVSTRTGALLADVGYGMPFVDALICDDLDEDGLDDFIVASGRNVRAFSRRCFQ